MNAAEKLQAIRARCVELLAAYSRPSLIDSLEAKAALRSTIAAIDAYEELAGFKQMETMIKTILAEWENLI